MPEEELSSAAVSSISVDTLPPALASQVYSVSVQAKQVWASAARCSWGFIRSWMAQCFAQTRQPPMRLPDSARFQPTRSCFQHFFTCNLTYPLRLSVPQFQLTSTRLMCVQQRLHSSRAVQVHDHQQRRLLGRLSFQQSLRAHTTNPEPCACCAQGRWPASKRKRYLA